MQGGYIEVQGILYNMTDKKSDKSDKSDKMRVQEIDRKYTVKYDYLMKVVLVGDINTGKTSIMHRYETGKFYDTLDATVGIDFTIKSVKLDDKIVKLQIWDTAGHENYRTITTSYYRNAMSIIVVYDVSDFNTFENISYWLKEIDKHAPQHTIIVLVGNKCDSNKRIITTEMGKKMAEYYGIDFFETSSKEGTNINELFAHIICSLKERVFDKGFIKRDTTTDLLSDPKKVSCCGII